jgi:hypothetical protein
MNVSVMTINLSKTNQFFFNSLKIKIGPTFVIYYIYKIRIIYFY